MQKSDSYKPIRGYLRWIMVPLSLGSPILRADPCERLFQAFYENRLSDVRDTVRREKDAVSNCKDPKTGKPVLISAVIVEDFELVELLTEHGANLETPFGSPEKTALFYSLTNSKLNVIKLLLERGAKSSGMAEHATSAIRKKLILDYHQKNSPCKRKEIATPLGGAGHKSLASVKNIIGRHPPAKIKKCDNLPLQEIEKQMNSWAEDNFYRKRFIPIVLPKLRDPKNRSARAPSVTTFCEDETRNLVSIMVDVHSSKVKPNFLEIGFLISSPTIRGGGRAALESAVATAKEQHLNGIIVQPFSEEVKHFYKHMNFTDEGEDYMVLRISEN